MIYVKNTLALLLILILAVSGVEALTLTYNPSTPPSDFITSEFNFSVTASGGPAGQADMEFTMAPDGQFNSARSTNKTFKITIDELEGEYTMDIRAWMQSNATNNVSGSYGPLKIDRKNPDLTPLQSSLFNITNATIDQEITIGVDVDDLYLDSVAAGLASTINQTSIPMDNPGGGDNWELSTTPSALGCDQAGNCLVSVRAEDEAGNVKIISENLMIVDESSAPPAQDLIRIIFPQNGVEQEDSVVPLEFEVDISEITVPDETVFCTYLMKDSITLQTVSYANYFEEDFNVSGSILTMEDEIADVNDGLYILEVTCDDDQGESYMQNSSFPLFDVTYPDLEVETNVSNTSATVTLNSSEDFRVNYFKYKELGADENTSIFIDVEDDLRKSYEISIPDLLPDTFYVFKLAYEDKMENDDSISENFHTLGGVENDTETEPTIYDIAAGIVEKETKNVMPGENYSHGISSIKKDQEVEIVVTNFDMNIREFIIAGNADMRNVKLDVSTNAQAPSWIQNPIPSTGNVFEYIQVITENAPETSLKYVKIRFEVNQRWITENNLKNDGIALFRMVDGEWKQLPTTLLSEGALFNKYEALSPGFSLFAVAMKRNAVADQESETQAVELQQDQELETEPETEEEPAVNNSGGKLDLSFGLPWHWLVIGVLGIVILVFLTYHVTISVGGETEDLEEHRVVKAHMKRLEEFVDQALEQGHSREALRGKLIESGWEEKIVDFVLRRK